MHRASECTLGVIVSVTEIDDVKLRAMELAHLRVAVVEADDPEDVTPASHRSSSPTSADLRNVGSAAREVALQ